MSARLLAGSPERSDPSAGWFASVQAAWRRLGPVRTLAMRDERQRLKRLLIYGVLWAMLFTAVEVPNLQDGSTSLATIVPVTLQLMSDFLIISGGLVIAVFWATTVRGGWRRLCIGVLAASALGSTFVAFCTSSLLLRLFNATASGSVVMRNKSDALQFAVLSFHFWLALVYGGSAAVLYALRRRIDQTTMTLRSATLARERNEAAIAEAQVRSMVERIEPDFLLEVMRAAHRHYAVDVARGESIVNGCVAFLRSAMPQIRSQHSDLAAELEVADAYLTLRALISSEPPPSWRIERSACASESDVSGAGRSMPLPPLLFLPILERLLAAMAAGRAAGPLVVRDRSAGHVTCVDIEIACDDDVAAPIDAACLAAINERLRATSGPDTTIVVDRPRASRLTYRLQGPADACAPFDPNSTEPSSTHQETS